MEVCARNQLEVEGAEGATKRVSRRTSAERMAPKSAKHDTEALTEAVEAMSMEDRERSATLQIEAMELEDHVAALEAKRDRLAKRRPSTTDRHWIFNRPKSPCFTTYISIV